MASRPEPARELGHIAVANCTAHDGLGEAVNLEEQDAGDRFAQRRISVLARLASDHIAVVEVVIVDSEQTHHDRICERDHEGHDQSNPVRGHIHALDQIDDDPDQGGIDHEAG